MMKKYFLALCVFLTAFSQITHAQQDFNAEFKIVFDKNDLAGQEEVLKNWEKSKPDDAELYVAYFNFYLNKSRKETVTFSSTPQSKEALKMTKDDDKNVVAFLGSQQSFEKKDFDKAIEYISKGIERFPNRLDMRFGKTAAYGKIDDYTNYTNEIVKATNYSSVNKNQWLWMNNQPVANPKKMFLSTVQDYFIQVYDSGDENTEYLKTIAETVLKHYPDSVENLSNLAIYYLLKDDFDSALIPLLKAEKLAPTDYIILSNIAWSFYSKADKANSLKYYELVMKYGNDSAKSNAKAKIAELKKKK